MFAGFCTSISVSYRPSRLLRACVLAGRCSLFIGYRGVTVPVSLVGRKLRFYDFILKTLDAHQQHAEPIPGDRCGMTMTIVARAEER
jgi:hypothetical protein